MNPYAPCGSVVIGLSNGLAPDWHHVMARTVAEYSYGSWGASFSRIFLQASTSQIQKNKFSLSFRGPCKIYIRENVLIPNIVAVRVDTTSYNFCLLLNLSPKYLYMYTCMPLCMCRQLRMGQILIMNSKKYEQEKNKTKKSKKNTTCPIIRLIRLRLIRG